MSDFIETKIRANTLAAGACMKGREQRALDVRAGVEYGKAAELVEGSPKTLLVCVRNSIECFMRAQDWREATATVERWVGDHRLDKSRAYLERIRDECEAKIAEAT